MSNRIDSTSHGRGFTLVEILVTITIVVLLAGILLPLTFRAMRSAKRTRTAADLQAIAVALEAYKTDHGDYPRVGKSTRDQEVDGDDNPDYLTGAQVLVRALVAPGPDVDPGGTPQEVFDGAKGPGFRVRGTQGRVYGPYLKTEQFKLRDIDDVENENPDLNAKNLVFVDANNKPILYFPARSGNVNIRIDTPDNHGAYFDQSTQSFIDADDNLELMRRQDASLEPVADALERMQVMLGDSRTINGKIDDGETAAFDGPFILWAAGADGVFGPTMDMANDEAVLDAVDAQRCDDVTNFNVAP